MPSTTNSTLARWALLHAFHVPNRSRIVIHVARNSLGQLRLHLHQIYYFLICLLQAASAAIFRLFQRRLPYLVGMIFAQMTWPKMMVWSSFVNGKLQVVSVGMTKKGVALIIPRTRWGIALKAAEAEVHDYLNHEAKLCTNFQMQCVDQQCVETRWKLLESAVRSPLHGHISNWP